MRTDLSKHDRTTNCRTVKIPNRVPNRMPANRTDQDQPVRQTVCVICRTTAYELSAPKLWRRAVRINIVRVKRVLPVRNKQCDRIDANPVSNAVYRVEY